GRARGPDRGVRAGGSPRSTVVPLRGPSGDRSNRECSRMKKTRPGVVSVVVVDYNGADDTIACLNGLAELDWPRDLLEVVVVETGASESAAAIRAAHPSARVVDAHANLGFAGGCNRGVAEAAGEYVAF